MPNNKKHWGDVISSLDSDSVAFEAEQKDAATSAKQHKDAENEKSDKKRNSRSGGRKRSASKKELEPAAFDLNLLDSSEAPEPKIDLTVGNTEKKETRSRRRAKKSEGTAGLVEKAVAEEEKKERAKRKKLADVIVEKAKEPFRKIASQLEERIQDLTQEESKEAAADPAAEEKSAKKSWKPNTNRRKKKTEHTAPEETSVPADASCEDLKTEAASGNFWDIEDSLEVSWGRAPKSADSVPEPEFAEESNDDAAVSAPDAADADSAKKLSRRDAENRFASLFDEKQASEDEVDDFRKRSCRSRIARQEEDAAPVEEPVEESAETPVSLDDNSFWGIPDEPEVGFASRGKTEKKTEPSQPKQSVPAAAGASCTERNDRGARKEREARREEPRTERREAQVPERREGRRDRRDRRDRNDAERAERGISRSNEEAVSGSEKVFPTWQDAIGEMIRHNIGRHSGGNRGGDRRKK